MEEILEGIFVETGYEGVNVAAILSERGVIGIDTPSYPRDARDWVMRVERLQSRPFRYIILTDGCGDRVLNTRWLNAPIIGHHSVAEKLASFEKRYPHGMLESLSKRNPKQGRDLSYGPVEKVSLSFTQSMELFTERYRLILKHAPGPTVGNILVEVADHQIIFTGDLVAKDTYPAASELEWDDWCQTLDYIVKRYGSDDLCLIPGRGAIANLEDVQETRVYLKRLHEVVMQHISDELPRIALKRQVESLIANVQGEEFLQDWATCQTQLALERIYDAMALLDSPGDED